MHKVKKWNGDKVYGKSLLENSDVTKLFQTLVEVDKAFAKVKKNEALPFIQVVDDKPGEKVEFAGEGGYTFIVNTYGTVSIKDRYHNEQNIERIADSLPMLYKAVELSKVRRDK